ncbi:MAG: tRNA (adenosine(37)-N6)-threonylcarbamoyltransferase complex dimerization subunit type 1 TsaB [Spirochaetia bacterium]|nr:tRNA (adenosine(37)-N6)-threonylcarbamoyltransferase complex dimerization subunit type 1 TsaB [Spirochaetia bacterium]
MKMLLVDTSGKEIAIAVYDGKRCISLEYIKAEQNYNKVLIPLIDGIMSRSGLKYTDIGLFAATLGPGSFTGIRVGMAAMKGFAQPLGAQFDGRTVLEIMANSVNKTVKKVWAVMDAGRGEFYTACYNAKKNGLTETTPPVLVTQEYMLKNAGKGSVIVSLRTDGCGQRLMDAGCSAYLEELEHVDMDVFAGLIAGNEKKDGRKRLFYLGPVYVRPSEAEAALKKNRCR